MPEHLISGLEREVKALRNIYTRIEVMAEDEDTFSEEEVQAGLMEAMKVGTNISINLLAPTIATMLTNGQSIQKVSDFLTSVMADSIARAIATLARADGNDVPSDEILCQLLERLKNGPSKTNAH